MPYCEAKHKDLAFKLANADAKNTDRTYKRKNKAQYHLYEFQERVRTRSRGKFTFTMFWRFLARPNERSVHTMRLAGLRS